MTSSTLHEGGWYPETLVVKHIKKKTNFVQSVCTLVNELIITEMNASEEQRESFPWHETGDRRSGPDITLGKESRVAQTILCNVLSAVFLGKQASWCQLVLQRWEGKNTHLEMIG